MRISRLATLLALSCALLASLAACDAPQSPAREQSEVPDGSGLMLWYYRESSAWADTALRDTTRLVPAMIGGPHYAMFAGDSRLHRVFTFDEWVLVRVRRRTATLATLTLYPMDDTATMRLIRDGLLDTAADTVGSRVEMIVGDVKVVPAAGRHRSYGRRFGLYVYEKRQTIVGTTPSMAREEAKAVAQATAPAPRPQAAPSDPSLGGAIVGGAMMGPVGAMIGGTHGP